MIRDADNLPIENGQLLTHHDESNWKVYAIRESGEDAGLYLERREPFDKPHTRYLMWAADGSSFRRTQSELAP